MSTITIADEPAMRLMVSKGMLISIKNGLKNCDEDQFSHIMWCISNIISEITDFKIMLYELGVYNQVFILFDNYKHKQAVREVFAWLVSNSFKSRPLLNQDIVN